MHESKVITSDTDGMLQKISCKGFDVPHIPDKPDPIGPVLARMAVRTVRAPLQGLQDSVISLVPAID